MKQKQSIAAAWWFPPLLVAFIIWFTCDPKKTEVSHAPQPQAPAETAAEPQRIDVEAVTPPKPTPPEKTKNDTADSAKSKSDASETQKGMQSAEDYQKEEKLLSLFLGDEKLVKSVEIAKMKCEGNTCQIEAEAKADNTDNFQMLFVDFLEKNPEYGNKLKINPNADNPRFVTFTFIKE